jgi:RNA polymerase subunit RPABC4/transcription elongation factor Spt4
MKDNTTEPRVCPICGKTYKETPAISRIDDRTPICPDCGTRQALDSIGISKEEQEKIIEIIHRTIK